MSASMSIRASASTAFASDAPVDALPVDALPAKPEADPLLGEVFFRV